MDKDEIVSIVKDTMKNEFTAFLKDIEFRLAQTYEVARRSTDGLRTVFAEDLNIMTPFITGYTVSNNTPSAGYIAWSSLNVVYNGTTNAITDGNSNLMYIWWDPAVSSTVLQTSNTQPTLSAEAALIFVNNSGTASVAIGATMPPAVGQNSVNEAAIVAGAVTSTALASGAVTAGAIASGAVGSSALAASAVTSTAIASGAVGNTQLASGAVESGNIASGAVTSTALASGAVTSAALADGAVSATNLNLLTHFIF